MTPHPEHEIAERVTRLQRAAPADVLVWTPLSSVSGKWEAAGEGWLIEEESPSRFCDLLEARISGIAY